MSNTLECLQCSDEFEQQEKELFCCYECRLKFWKAKALNKKSINGMHLDDLRFVVEKTKADAKNLRWHFDRLEHDYSDWEDRLVKIEQCIRIAEEVVEIEEQEIDNIKQQRNVDFDVMDELFSENE